MNEAEKDTYKPPLTGGMEDSKAYRRFVASSSADSTDNRAVWSSEMNDAFAALHVQESTGVKDREEKLPLGLRILSSLLWITAILCCVGAYVLVGNGNASTILVIAAVVCVILRIVISIWKYHREQKAWINRVNGSQ